MAFHFITPTRSWIWQLAIAAGSMACALVLTHTFWRFLQQTPFLLCFGAAALSSRLGGRSSGFCAVLFGVLGCLWVPLPLPAEGFTRLLFGFVVVSGSAGWLIARRYEIEADLRANQRRLHAVVSSLPVVVWVIDRGGRVTLAEGSGLEMLNLNPRELVGRSVFELYRDVPEIIANIERALDGRTFTAVVALGDRVVETWFSPLRDDQGAMTGAIGVSLDVTTRRRLEQQYLQAQKMEAVGQMAAGVAHDFNNLLVAIGGYAELVMGTLDVSDARHADLLEVRKAAGRAAILTRQLLAFSRRQVVHPKVLDLNFLVGNVQKLLRRTLCEDIDLVLSLNAAVEPIRADPTDLEHVLLNLALNARDAMPGGGQLRFATENVDVDEALAARFRPMSTGRYVRLIVADTGTGMTPEIQARIFEPFFTTKDHSHGTGLGLATAYGIVKQSGGFIWVNSRRGSGTSFEIYFPAVPEAIDSPDDTEHVRPTCGGSETIVLAEDDGAVRRLASEVLKRWGYTVLDARDGEEALVVARAHSGIVHLLITDVMMPGLGGRALAVKLTEDHPVVRVLYTSGHATDVMLRGGIERSVPFLPKPFLPLDLVRIVREVLDAPTSGTLSPVGSVSTGGASS
jgi:two-component system, cell cycle sensor histidine kinase and response regulator CckA